MSHLVKAECFYPKKQKPRPKVSQGAGAPGQFRRAFRFSRRGCHRVTQPIAFHRKLVDNCEVVIYFTHAIGSMLRRWCLRVPTELHWVANESPVILDDSQITIKESNFCHFRSNFRCKLGVGVDRCVRY